MGEGTCFSKGSMAQPACVVLRKRNWLWVEKRCTEKMRVWKPAVQARRNDHPGVSLTAQSSLDTVGLQPPQLTSATFERMNPRSPLLLESQVTHCPRGTGKQA